MNDYRIGAYKLRIFLRGETHDFEGLFLIFINERIEVDYRICHWSTLPSKKNLGYANGFRYGFGRTVYEMFLFVRVSIAGQKQKTNVWTPRLLDGNHRHGRRLKPRIIEVVVPVRRHTWTNGFVIAFLKKFSLATRESVAFP